jgi:hypothetical protein
MQGPATAREKPPAQEQGRTGKKQFAEQWKQSDIRARPDVRLCTPDAAQLWFPCKIQENYRAAFARPRHGWISISVDLLQTSARPRAFFLFWTLDSGLWILGFIPGLIAGVIGRVIAGVNP